jgi:hypothetical protein
MKLTYMIEQDTEKTVVVFRECKTGEIIALFPMIEYPNGTCLSYMHFGQHGEADYTHVVRSTTHVRSNETWKKCLELKEELELLGYNLRVQMQRWRKR